MLIFQTQNKQAGVPNKNKQTNTEVSNAVNFNTLQHYLDYICHCHSHLQCHITDKQGKQNATNLQTFG